MTPDPNFWMAPEDQRTEEQRARGDHAAPGSRWHQPARLRGVVEAVHGDVG